MTTEKETPKKILLINKKGINSNTGRTVEVIREDAAYDSEFFVCRGKSKKEPLYFSKNHVVTDPED